MPRLDAADSDEGDDTDAFRGSESRDFGFVDGDAEGDVIFGAVEEAVTLVLFVDFGAAADFGVAAALALAPTLVLWPFIEAESVAFEEAKPSVFIEADPRALEEAEDGVATLGCFDTE